VLRVSPTDRLALEIFRRFPPRTTIFLRPEGRAEVEYADEVRFGIHRFVGLGEDLYRDRDVLDLGCGFGGRTVRFAELGARSVTGVEIDDEIVEHCRDFADRRGADVDFRTGAGESLPLPDASVDLILMNDVMEHVVDPERVLAECARVLRPGGRVATVFPPYYDVTSGSHLHGYATRVPGLNLVFRTGTLKRAARARLEEQGVEWRRYLREEPSDRLWNQNGLTVHGFRRLVRRSPLVPERVLYLGHRDHRVADPAERMSVLRRVAFAAFELPAQVPLLQELCCLRICAVLSRGL
jgi:SAM-dependent methyltransferase